MDFSTVAVMRKPHTKHKQNWCTFCTFGARFFLVFGTSSPAILRNCIIFDGCSRALRRFDENEASSKPYGLRYPTLFKWMVWLNSGKNYANLSSKSHIKKRYLTRPELYITNKGSSHLEHHAHNLNTLILRGTRQLNGSQYSKLFVSALTYWTNRWSKTVNNSPL